MAPLRARRKSGLTRAIAAAAIGLLVASAAEAQGPGSGPRSLRVGVYQNEPKVFADENGRASGLFVDILEEIARAEGWTLSFVPCSWSECLDALEAGGLDLMPDVAYSRERDERFDFHETPVLESWSQVYCRSDTTIRGLADLAGRRVAVLRGSIQEAAFGQMTAGFGLAVTMVPKESLAEAFDAVRSGGADVAVANHFFGDYFHREYGLVGTPIVFQVAQLYFVTPRGRNPDVLRAIDRHLGEWRGRPNSSYYTTLARWMERPPVRIESGRAAWIVAASAGMLLFAVALIVLLRMQVNARNRRLRRADEDRRRLEDQLRQSMKMEAIGKLAGGVAHDFNNLLTVILNYTELALLARPPDDPTRKYLDDVLQAGLRAAALTRQLLAFSRRQVLEPKPVDLNRIATDLDKMLRRIVGEDVDLTLALAPDLGVTLADPGQVEQVLMNLVVNARDAMPRGGRVTIETANVELDEAYSSGRPDATPGPHVVLSVTDTGCGMDEQTRSRIFEPFFTTKEAGKGTGLGLSTAYGIVRQSGGHITVYSEPGHGATFRVYLPRRQPDVAQPSPAAPPSESTGGTETVLVVEDEEAVRNLAVQVLRSAGYAVLIATGAEDAEKLCAGHAGEIHLLLTDVIMPRASGRVLAERLAAARPRMKVLYMSGYSGTAIAQQGVLESGARFLGKPFTMEELKRKVRDALDSR